eukprot:212474-Amphidinium_carterae.1
MACTKRRFNLLPLPEAKRAKNRTLLAKLEAGSSPLIRARIAFLSMDHASKSSNKRMLFVELKDESTPTRVVRLTVLGERHIAALKNLVFGATAEIEGADCTEFRGHCSLFANSRSSFSVRLIEDDGTFPDCTPDITAFAGLQPSTRANVLMKVCDYKQFRLHGEDPHGVMGVIQVDEKVTMSFEVGKCYCLHRLYVARDNMSVLYPDAGVEEVTAADFDALAN